jgi:hypothetical protein
MAPSIALAHGIDPAHHALAIREAIFAAACQLEVITLLSQDDYVHCPYETHALSALFDSAAGQGRRSAHAELMLEESERPVVYDRT